MESFQPVAVITRVGLSFGPSSSPAAGRPQVDGRTGKQWLQAAIAYCNFRAGDSWRSLANPAQRNSDDRWYYLRGARFLSDALLGFRNEPRIALALPVLNPVSSPSPFQIELAARLKRAELVARLMAADSALTDRRLLLRLSRVKLAGMLIAAERACLTLERRSA